MELFAFIATLAKGTTEHEAWLCYLRIPSLEALRCWDLVGLLCGIQAVSIYRVKWKQLHWFPLPLELHPAALQRKQSHKWGRHACSPEVA